MDDPKEIAGNFDGQAHEDHDFEEHAPEEHHEELDGSHEEDGVSLEELSQTYARLLAVPDDSDGATDAENATAAGDTEPEPNAGMEEDEESDTCPITPLSIIEAVLMVGRPDSGPITSSEIAALMRGVQEAEITEYINDLNASYEQSGSALRVVESGIGYRLQLAEDLKNVIDRFYGRVREVKLNQASIDCLALVAYQPGIARQTLEEQRGEPSGAVLNQLVRRGLLEIRREGEGKQLTPHYYPTNRLLELAGLSSLEDLPQVEDWQ